MSHPRQRSLAAAAAFSALAMLSACSGGDGGTAGGEGKGVSVVTAFYPLQYLTERIGGDHVAVTNLTPPGAEPHDLELGPTAIATLDKATLVVELAGFQPAVDDAVAQVGTDKVLDVGPAAHLEEVAAVDGEDGHDHDELSGKDPHFWLDPTRFADVADAVGAALAKADPEHAADYEKNAAALRTELTGLDEEFSTGLAQCRADTIVTSHEAFGYLAERYHLHQVGISGVDPEAEPSPARLAQIRQVVKDKDVSTIFTEALLSPKVAQVLADELGVEVAVLDPIESVADGQDYLSVMRTNLGALRTALDCA